MPDEATSLEYLRQLGRAISEETEQAALLAHICQTAAHLIAADSAALLFYNPDRDTWDRAAHWGPVTLLDQTSETTAALAAALLKGPPAITHTSAGDLVVTAVPIVSRRQVLALLYTVARQPHPQQDLPLTLLVGMAAPVVENARLLTETMQNARALEWRARNLLLINRIASDLSALLDPYEIFETIARHMVQLIEVDHCSVLVFDPGSPMGIIVAEHPSTGLVGQRLVRTEHPAIDRVLSTRKPLSIADLHTDPLTASIPDERREVDVRAILIVPLIARDQLLGLLKLDVLYTPRTFTRDEVELCRTVAAQAAIAASNARLLYDLQQQSRALSRKSQELAQESSKLDAILTNMADGLVVTDAAGRIILSNPAFRSIAGLPPHRSLRDHLLDSVFPVAALRQTIAEALEQPDQAAAANIELPDGRVLKATASVLRIRQPGEPLDSQIAGVVTVLRDITHEVEVDRIKTDFISTVSHELRTPLTSVLGFTSLIRREFQRHISPHLDDEARTRQAAQRILENLTIIETESQRLTRLINDVLDLAKMESGRAEWHMTSLDIAAVVDDAVRTAQVLADEKHLPLRLQLPPDLPIVWGDHDRLIQVMSNLLSNAIKFTDRGEITVRAWAWNQPDAPPPVPHIPPGVAPPALILAVSDTGIGIPAQDLPFVFERFRQVGDTLTEKPAGTGLGLSICQQIIAHHGGAIWVTSRPGHGSTFFFSLPLTPQLQEEQARAAPVRERVSERLPLDRERPPLILIVDDEENIRRLLNQELSQTGYRVAQARDGVEALSLARRLRPDLIILDVMMPGVSGFDVTGALKADPRTADIPLLILSIVEDRERGLQLGADEYLTKPVDLDRLLETVDALIRQVPTEGQEKPKVLVADGDISVVEAITRVLRERGMEVVEAYDPRGAIRQAARARPDLVILDEMLSEMNDYELLKALRYQHYDQPLSIIVMATRPAT